MKPQTIRFGIVGSGPIADAFLAAGRTIPTFEAGALYSRDAAKASALARRNAIPQWFSSLEDMARFQGIDAVYLASPNALHASQARLFIDHGKHVLCEKPVCSTRAEFESLSAHARASSLLLMEALKVLPSPGFQALRAALPRVGQIRRFQGVYCQYSSRYDDFRKGIVHNVFDPAMSGGALMDIGIYPVAALVALFGLPDNMPASISARSLLLPNGIDGQGSIGIDYGTMEALVVYSKIAGSGWGAEIQGEEGTLGIDSVNEIRELWYTGRKGGREVLWNSTSDHPMAAEINEFIRCIHECKVESGVNSHGLSLGILAILDEARAQGGIKFPADHHNT